MEIIFEKETEIMGEPGPNLLFKGTTHDFLKFVNALHPLGTNNDYIMRIDNGRNGIKLLNFNSLAMESSGNGRVLLSKRNGDIMMNLSKQLWIIIISKFLLVSFSSGHQYIEFDNLDLIEEANILLSSV